MDGGRAGTVSACEAALTGGATFITLSPSPAPALLRPRPIMPESISSRRTGSVFLNSKPPACVARFGTLADFAAKVRALPFGKRGAFGLGIALDGGPEPTCPAEHLFVIRELRREKSGDFHSFFALAGGAGGVRFRVPAACIDRPHLRGVPARGSV